MAGAMRKPRPIGTTITAIDTLTMPRALPFNAPKSSSSPTRNMNRMSATCPTMPRTERDCGGNMHDVMLGAMSVPARLASQCRNPGALPQWNSVGPSSVGPSRMPAMISPTTIGWPIRRKSAPTARATTKMITRSSTTNDSTKSGVSPAGAWASVRVTGRPLS